MQYSSIRILIATMLFVIMPLFLLACGGGSGGGSSSGGTGTVAMLLTDGPAQEFDEVNITVIRSELLGDDRRVTLFEGEETFNLLELTDARLFAIRSAVPAGHYDKIRLTLSHVALVKKDEFDNITEMYEPKLPGNGKLDLVPRGDMAVVNGETLVVQIDMDANKSIHIVGTGSGKYQFRPVVFVDVISENFLGKFLQVHGVIDAINGDDREFLLCETAIAVRHDNDGDDGTGNGCVQVAVVEDTAIFAADGNVARFTDLVEGEEATVYGRLRREDDGDDRSAARELDDMELVAATIELGGVDGFQKLDGVAESVVDDAARFSFSIDPGQGFADGTTVTVQLQDGTKVINRRGDLLGPADIGPGVAMKVDGILDLATDPDQLNASLVVVDSDATAAGVLSGTLGSNPDGACGLTLITDSGDRSVRTGTATQIFLVTTTALLGTSAPVTVADLPSGLPADVYGAEGDGGCFDAATIIAFDMLI